MFFTLTYRYENVNSFLLAKGHIYFSKWVYAVLGFPFLFYSIPVISTLLSRARPTSYDEYGNTVPYIGTIDYKEEMDLLENMDIEKKLKKLKIIKKEAEKNAKK